MTARATLAAVAVAAVLASVAGCNSGGGTVPRNSAGQVTAAATTDAFSIKVGDCIGKLASDSTDELPLLPCDQPHFWEAFAAANLNGDAFPGNAEVKDQAAQACKAAFEDFIAVAQGDSKYEVTFLTPTKETWTQAGDRQVVCLVGSSGGNLTGSLKGAAK